MKKYFLTAAQCFLNGNLDAAYQDFSGAIQTYTNFRMAYYHRSLVWMDFKRPKDALADLDRAIDINSKRPDLYHDRGIVLYYLEVSCTCLQDLSETKS